MASSNVLGKTVLLVIVLILIGFLYAQTLENSVIVDSGNKTEMAYSGPVLVEVTKEVEKPQSRQIVTDRFTTDIDQDGVVVVVDGSNAYSVKKGAVIVDDNIIRVTDEEYTVDFTDSPRRVVSSN